MLFIYFWIFFFKKIEIINNVTKPKMGKYISGNIIKDKGDGKVSNWKIALLRPLPKLVNMKTEGKIPKNVPR